MKNTPMLLATVNNSIGNKKNHLSLTSLCSLFDLKKSEYTNIEKYAIDTIQNEASKEEILSFKKKYNVSQEEINHILSASPY